MWFGFQDKVSYAYQASLEFIATPLPQLPSAEINESDSRLNLILHLETAQQLNRWLGMDSEELGGAFTELAPFTWPAQ